MSANGAVVAGNPGGGMGGLSGTWQWKNGTLIQSPGGTGYATAVSPDGSVVVGSTGTNGSGGLTQAFEWTSAGVTPLTWPAGYVTGSATAVSTAGSTIVGEMSPPGNGGGGGGGGQPSAAFIWNQATGVQNLQQLLIANDGLGPSLTGWTLTAATGITPDGNTIVGNGIDRQGQQEGWIAKLNPPLQSITVTPANTSLPTGETEQFTATGTLSNNTTENLTNQVTWTSSDTTWATISATGLATAVSPGPVTISAAFDGVTGSTGLTVVRPATLQSIAVTPVNTSLPTGETEQFTAIGTLSNNTTENLTNQVTWASSDTTWATISTTGLATAVSPGPVTISATFDGITGSTGLTVTAVVLQSITVTPANTSLPTGQTEQFTAIGTLSNNTTENLTSQVTWASSDTTWATINTTGLATAVSPGPVTISASFDGITGSTGLTVVTTMPPPVVIETETFLTAKPRPSNFGQPVTLTASVKIIGNGPRPAGTVTFSEGSIILGTAPLRGGKSSFTTSALPVGQDAIQASYGGDPALSPSSSALFFETVRGVKTKTKLTSSADPSRSGQAVTFSARVSIVGPGVGSPTGTVSFLDGARNLGTIPLVGGEVTFTTNFVTARTHSIKAVYNGSADFGRSTSNVLRQTVKQSTQPASRVPQFMARADDRLSKLLPEDKPSS